MLSGIIIQSIIYASANLQRYGSTLDGMGITYIHLKNPIFTFCLLSISILTMPNENWGGKVSVIKNQCVYHNGKGVKIVNNHFT